MWMAFMDTLWKAWNAVKWFFWLGTKEAVNEPVEESTPSTNSTTTLNDVASDINRNNVTQQQVVNPDPLGQFNKQQEAQQEANDIIDAQQPDPVQVWFVNPNDTEVDWDMQAAIDAKNSEEGKHRWDRVLDLWKEAVSGTVNIIKWLNANADYNAEKQDVAMYYDKDSWDIYYLDINTSRWLADWDTWAYDWAQVLFNKAYQEFIYDVNNAKDDPAQVSQAWYDFYEKTNNLFRLRADDYYTDWLFTWKNWKLVWRRKDMYSDEQLDALANNEWVDKAWAYVPSFEEFQTYVTTLSDNENLKQNIFSNYWLNSEESDTIDLSASTQKKRSDGFYNKAMNWVMDAAKQYLNEDDASKTILSSASFINDQSSRIQSIVQEIYKYEQIVLAIPENQRTEWDLAILDAANQLRQMEEMYAWNLSSMLIQNIKYWRDSNNELSEMIDTFEWGLTLNQLLTNNLKAVAWWNFNKKDSAIDVFQEVANKALYEYNKGSKGIWARMQRLWEKGWNWLWEVWQQTIYNIMWIRNVIYDVATWDFQSIWDALAWRKPLSTSANYADNDISIAQLIQTDMWNNSRTIYKYYLNWLEYVPEGLWNLAPDIALIAVSWWTWIWVPIVKWWARANEAIKAGKATWLLWKIIKSAEYSNVAKSTLTGIERVTALARAAQEANPTIRIWAQLLDAAVTNWVLDQAIDAQWSAFDTEPYSNTSMILSLAGTWLWEFLPIILKTWIWNKLLWWNTIFNISEYMRNNADGLANIARAVNKNMEDITYIDLKNYLKNFDAIEAAAKQVYNDLPIEWKDAANRWTKEVLYNYLNQFYDLNSQSDFARRVRSIVTNGSLTASDLFKYIGKIPWDVEFWPFVSKIQLKNWTKASVYSNWWYDTLLDTLDGWFAPRVSWGFSIWDIDKISKLDNYSDIIENKNKWFYERSGRYYLTEEWLTHFNLTPESLTLEALWLKLADVENTKETLKTTLKNITSNKKLISDETVDAIAETGAYDEIVEKVKEIVC